LCNKTAIEFAALVFSRAQNGNEIFERLGRLNPLMCKVPAWTVIDPLPAAALGFGLHHFVVVVVGGTNQYRE
jgi:hypothetical protein